MTSFGERIVTKEPLWCEHCGFLENVFVQYVQGAASYCPNCAYANSWITDADLTEDEIDNLESAVRYYEKRVRELRHRLLLRGRVYGYASKG